ncbi:MAG: hypothetical protein GY862_15615 [Gammaproteobacteria bacterium]|nr:hypothetical protein [Gammaproteobacteria bacterium]
MNIPRIKKTVGQAKFEEPLARAFRLHLMVLELTGKQVPTPDNVRKLVKPPRLSHKK